MYTKMLIPLDGSKVAEQVLPYARFLSKRLSIQVDLLQVADPDALALLTDPEHSRYADTVWADRINSGKAYLEGVGRSFDGARVRCVIEKGKPEDVIIERAADDENALVIMATHGRSGIQRWLLGSIADKVLHGSSNHVFLVRATEQGAIGGETALKTVIVPLDGSALAEQALPRAGELAKALSLRIILVRAYALPPAATGDDYGTYTQEIIDQIETEARDYLAARQDELKQRGLGTVTAVAKFGYGADEIISLARETADNFVAMCTHGRSGVKRFALGSVTDRVVRHSGDPVLIIRS